MPVRGRVYVARAHSLRSAAYAPGARPDLQGMTCETCAAPGRTFQLIGTAEALCVDCFLVAHPPAAEPAMAACPAASRGAARSHGRVGRGPRAVRRPAPRERACRPARGTRACR